MIFIKIFKSIVLYNKKRKILIIFDDMIADMLSNKKLNPMVTELFIRGRSLKIYLVFIIQSYFIVPKSIWLNSTHNFIMKISNKRELKEIAFNHSSDIDSKTFLVINATLASDNPWRSRKNVLEGI